MASALLDRPSKSPAAERPARWSPSPPLRGAELAWVVVAGIALAVLTSWPLALHTSSRISPDLGDPIRTAWQIAWVGHAMLNDPLHIFDSNAFYPHPLSLAFSDSLLGYGPAAFFGSGTVAALVRYNLLFLFAWSLCFVGAYLLGRELGLCRIGAAAVGVAFAYAPYRVTEAGHLHVISSGGIPLALFLLLRGYRRSSRGLVLAGWLVSAWQISLGFTLGLQYAYLLAILALLAVWSWWRGRGFWARRDDLGARAGADGRRGSTTRRPLLPRRLLAVTVIGVLVVGAVTVYEARPYLKVANEYPTAKRTLREVEAYSSGPAALLGASSENRVWGSLTSGMRAKVNSKNESIFFPGGLILLLALVGLVGVGKLAEAGPGSKGARKGASGDARGRARARGLPAEATDPRGVNADEITVRRAGQAAPIGNPYTRHLRLGLLAGIVVCSVLAFGLGLTGAGYPYRLLYDFAPGWDGVRVPGRVFTLATLCYALLAGAGVQLLMGLARRWGAARSLSALGAVVGVVLLIGILGEGAGHLGHPVVPQPVPAERGLPGPVLDLPTDGAADRLWQYFSTDGFYKIPVGNSTFDLPALDDLRGGMNGFPDRASVEKLRYYHIRTVVLHTVMPSLPAIKYPEVPEPPDPAAAAAKPIAGLGITRRRVGSLVIYEIGPGPAALHGSDS
ncbi:MAG TPA: hypothetical protein VMB51_04990 [Solirubrobacteraceae bacterium]|nr:hypothetical protein [Solirubrobacteraceae bacterium]